MTHIQVKL